MMFSRITGRVERVDEHGVVLDVAGLGYEILLPPCLAEPFRRSRPTEATFEIYTQLTIDGNSGKVTYFGFQNTVERAFFEALISVASIGPRSAARAFSKPMAEIARAIDAGDEVFLTTLPGIGRQKAREIIAKLQGKVARFLLIPDAASSAPSLPPAIADEAREVLLQLGYRVAEADRLVAETLAAEPGLADAESLLGAIYRRRSEVVPL